MLASLAEVTIRRRPWAVTLFSSSSIGTYDEQKPQQHHQQKVAAAEREEGREEGREHHHHSEQPAQQAAAASSSGSSVAQPKLSLWEEGSIASTGGL